MALGPLAVALAAALAACRQSPGTYQGYADRVAAVGDSALLAVSAYLAADSTERMAWNGDAAERLERLATAFGGIMRPDTVALVHRQMLEGLDSLVVAMRVLREREAACGRERPIDCVDARDFRHIRGSMRTGTRIYLEARRRMRGTLASLGGSLPDPPAIATQALRADGSG